jgi:hypothetical protein
MKMEKTCVYCRKKFQTSHLGSKYCSYLCYRLDVIAEMRNRYEPEREAKK